MHLYLIEISYYNFTSYFLGYNDKISLISPFASIAVVSIGNASITVFSSSF